MRKHALENFKRVGVDVRNDTAVVEVRQRSAGGEAEVEERGAGAAG